MSQYLQIRDGMSYSEVRTIMGDGGQEDSHSNEAGFLTVDYRWANGDGGNMSVMLQNDHVVMKAQGGLK